MGLTDGLKLPIPELTEMADGPDAFSDLGNAVEDYVYDRILPTGVTRWPVHHWGSGTAFPLSTALARSGDLYLHTGLACTMRCITPGSTQTNGVWRQAEIALVANATARLALSTNYTAQLYDGFRARELDTKRVYEWDGSNWFYAGGGTPPVFKLPYGTGWGPYTPNGTANGVNFAQPQYWKDGSGMVHGSGLVTAAAGATSQIGVLPVGYRPLNTEMFLIQIGNSTVGRADVLFDGQILLQGAAPVTSQYYSLNTIKFNPNNPI